MTRLCRAHRLHSALAFLFNRALADYTAPAAELLLAYVHARRESSDESPRESSPAGGWSARRATGYKLLVYLHCCLSGRAFPPGQSSTRHLPDVDYVIFMNLRCMSLTFSVLTSCHAEFMLKQGGTRKHVNFSNISSSGDIVRSLGSMGNLPKPESQLNLAANY